MDSSRRSSWTKQLDEAVERSSGTKQWDEAEGRSSGTRQWDEAVGRGSGTRPSFGEQWLGLVKVEVDEHTCENGRCAEVNCNGTQCMCKFYIVVDLP